jgi:hypothetical protein
LRSVKRKYVAKLVKILCWGMEYVIKNVIILTVILIKETVINAIKGVIRVNLEMECVISNVM